MFKLKREKKMKKRYLNIVVFALFVSMLLGCSDWTKPEAEDFFEMPGNDYYENLRAFGCVWLVWRLDRCGSFDGGESDGTSR